MTTHNSDEDTNSMNSNDKRPQNAPNTSGQVYRDGFGLHDGGEVHPFDLTDEQLISQWDARHQLDGIDRALADLTTASELGKRGYTLDENNRWYKAIE